MKQIVREISFETECSVSFVDVTERVRKLFLASGVREGTVTVFTQHTTAALRINERCDRLQQDMIQYLKRTVPEAAYLHDEDTVDDRPNARGHLMSLLMGVSETIPVSDGEMMLGVWQSIFFIELDGPRERRKVIVAIVGE